MKGEFLFIRLSLVVSHPFVHLVPELRLLFRFREKIVGLLWIQFLQRSIPDFTHEEVTEASSWLFESRMKGSSF